MQTLYHSLYKKHKTGNIIKNMNKHRFIKLILLALVAIIATGILYIRFNRQEFDADKVAIAEAQMWQAYYAGDRPKLGLLLVSLLRTQYGLSFIEAKETGEAFASSAMKFKSAKSNYEKAALPDLITAYTLIKEAKGLSFDPKEVAPAELAWWVARRTNGKNSAKQVGAKMTELYAAIYGSNHPSFQKAGLLRAQAAALRDAGRNTADWPQIEELLKESYRELEKGI